MSTIEEDVRQGRLEDALAGLQAAIRKALPIQSTAC